EVPKASFLMAAFLTPRMDLHPSASPIAPCSHSCASLGQRLLRWIRSSRPLGGIAQIFDPIMRAFDLAVLTRNDIAHRRRKVIAHRLFELLHSRVFTTLTLGKDCALLFAGDSGFQVDPTTMHCPGGAPTCFRLGFALASGVRLQLARKARSLLRIPSEKRFELGIIYRICRFFEAFLAIFKG